MSEVNKKDRDWLKYINTFLLAVISLIGSLLVSNYNAINEKLDIALRQQAATVVVDSEQSRRIGALEADNKTHMSREEYIKALDDLKAWVRDYYARK